MTTKRIRIYDIVRRYRERYFGQTLKSFSVKNLGDGRFCISAPSFHRGHLWGTTERIFDWNTGELEFLGKTK